METAWRRRPGPVRRLGLVLDAHDEPAHRAAAARVDALFVHRPWELELPDGLGVLAAHRAFDERLTLGRNPRLAAALGLGSLEVLGAKEERPIGMLARVGSARAEVVVERVEQVFGGLEETHGAPATPVDRVAVVGAMTDALVREAAARGAALYVSGQWRVPAAEAVEETGIAVAVVGHRRSELWGLRALAGLLRERFAGLEAVVLASG